jgi:hypothetical protein
LPNIYEHRDRRERHRPARLDPLHATVALSASRPAGVILTTATSIFRSPVRTRSLVRFLE